MPVLIPNEIPKRSFQLILDRIAQIVLLELSPQGIHRSNVVISSINKVWTERSRPYNASELPAINVAVNNVPSELVSYGFKTSDPVYFIDILANAPDSSGVRGDEVAAKTVHDIAGLIDGILSHPNYKILGFPPGLIQRVHVFEIQFFNVEPNQSNDAQNIMRARVKIRITAADNEQQLPSFELNELVTGVILEDSDQGYFYSNPDVLD